jgi:predicted ribosome quality control (RQC) complex YloA/Tae2 family protein
MEDRMLNLSIRQNVAETLVIYNLQHTMLNLRVKTLLNKVFTSFDVAAEAHELKNAIADARVNNIYQLDPKTLLLKLHKVDKPPLLLLLEAGNRFHLTAYAREKPAAPPAFCMALRKHLRNAWLRTVEQREFDRIVIFGFQSKVGVLHLILELFGEGNIVLTDGKGEILQALVFKRMRDRSIVRGEVYAFPPSSGRNPFNATKEELATDLKSCGDVEVVRTMARCLGVGGVYAEEILLRAEVEKTKRCTELSDADVDAVQEGLQSLLANVAAARFEPRIVLNEDGSFLDVVPFQLKRYETYKSRPFSSFDEALDEFYLRVTAAEKAADTGTRVDELRREAEKLRRVVAEQEQALREAEVKAEQDKQVGDLIYVHSVEIQTLLDRFAAARVAGRDLKSVASETSPVEKSGDKSEVMVEGFDARNIEVNVRVGAVRFSVSLRRSLFENAAEFYGRGKKAKQKAAGALAALEESRRKLDEAEQRMKAAAAEQLAKPVEVMEELVKRRVEGKEWYEKFRWFISSDGFLVVAGKDAVSNEVLIKKHVEKDDVVFHADVTGAPFVVVKAEGKTPSEQTLREGGDFAAAFSRAWREGLGAVDVYWVKPDQLSKTGLSGEYVAHGAFAVVGKRNWLRGVTLRVAVGVVKNGELHFMGGPVDAVKNKTNFFVTIAPGDMMGKQLLKQVLQALAVRLPKEQREKVGRASIEEIREFVPYTKGRLTEGS